MWVKNEYSPTSEDTYLANFCSINDWKSRRHSADKRSAVDEKAWSALDANLLCEGGV